MRKGEKREQEKDKEKEETKRREKREKGEKCPLLPQWRKRKVIRKKQRMSCSQQIVHLGRVVEKVLWNPLEMMFHGRVIIPSIFPAVRKYDKMLCLLCT